jgi:hypothetical protein
MYVIPQTPCAPYQGSVMDPLGDHKRSPDPSPTHAPPNPKSWVRPLLGIGFMVFNTTFNTISVISWRSVLLVEETGVPGQNTRPAASH